MTCLLSTTHVTYVTNDVILSINKCCHKKIVSFTFLGLKKGYGAISIMTEFPGRNWSLTSVKRLYVCCNRLTAAVFVNRISGWFYLEFNCRATLRCILHERQSHHLLRHVMWQSLRIIIYNSVKLYSWYWKICRGSLFSRHSVYTSYIRATARRTFAFLTVDRRQAAVFERTLSRSFHIISNLVIGTHGTFWKFAHVRSSVSAYSAVRRAGSQLHHRQLPSSL